MRFSDAAEVISILFQDKAVKLNYNYSNQYENCSKSKSTKFRIHASVSKLLLRVSKTDIFQQRQIKFQTFLGWWKGERDFKWSSIYDHIIMTEYLTYKLYLLA